MTFVSDEGTPIERWDTMTVRVDSTYQGYVIGATTKDGQTYTHGMTMRCFVGAWPFHYPTTAKLIERK
jgi:hypothetical protein